MIADEPFAPPACDVCGSEDLVGYLGRLALCGRCFHDLRRRPGARSFSWDWLVSCALGGLAVGFALAVVVMVATQ